MSRKRRLFSGSFKARVALAAIRGDRSTAELASQFAVHASQVTAWKKQLLGGVAGLFEDGRISPRRKDDRSAREEELYEQIGRLKSDDRYTNKLVYNNYPWPQSSTEKEKQDVEEKAQAVLDVREEFPDSSLAVLYDPVSMPPKLAKAHAALDKAVDKCYRPQPFISDRQRVEFLFGVYEQLTRPVLPADRPKTSRKKKT